jgi:cation:H+ antiporter
MNSSMLRSLKISFVAVLLPVFLLLDSELSCLDGVILVSAFIVYVIWLLLTGRKYKSAAESMRFSKRIIGLGVTVFLLIIGVTVLFIGSELVTESAQTLSTDLGLPLFLMGLIVAIGTCLPEMAFAVRAAEAKDGEIGIGNILGNVLADSMLTIGIIAIINPIKVPNLASPLSAGIFVVVSIVFVYLRSRDGNISKLDAKLLIGVYALFVILQYLFEVFGL